MIAKLVVGKFIAVAPSAFRSNVKFSKLEPLKPVFTDSKKRLTSQGDLVVYLTTIGGWDLSDTAIYKLYSTKGIIMSSTDPKITLVDGAVERFFIGVDSDGECKVTYTDNSGNLLFDLGAIDQNGVITPYISNYADHKAIELEMMKMNYQYISWAQFSIFDAFDNEDLRANPDPSTNNALVVKSQLTKADSIPGKVFGFITKTYDNITTVYSGTSTSVGLNFLTDITKTWFIDEPKNLTLKDSGSNTFNVESATSDTLTVVGTPTSGIYSLIDSNPTAMVGFCTLTDSSNGGYGSIKMEVSFNNGSNYQTIYETGVTDLRQATVSIINSGNNYLARFTLTNNGSGDGPIIYKFLICTDPSCWRF